MIPSAIFIDDGSPYYVSSKVSQGGGERHINSCQLLLHRLKRNRGPAAATNTGLDYYYY
jgi:hypothetical protein